LLHILQEEYKNAKPYTVKSGDTVNGIAAAHRTKSSLIIEFNDLRRPYIIRPGQTLYIPQ